MGQETAAVKGRGYSTQQAYDTCLDCLDRVLTQLCPASGSSVENELAQPSTLGYLVIYLTVLTYLTYLACPLVTVTLSPVLSFQSSLVQ